MASDLPPPRLSGWEQWFPPVVFLAVVVGVFTAVVVELRLPLPKGRSVRVDFSAIPLVRSSWSTTQLPLREPAPLPPPPHPCPYRTLHHIPLCMPLYSIVHAFLGSSWWQ
jgi:hypothetical protein